MIGHARSAFGLLTVAPVGRPGLTAASVPWFPLVGCAIGGAVAILDAALSTALPVWPVAVLDVAALAMLSGGLHIDGLADAADGLLGGGDRPRRLAVMREPAIGAFGVATVVLVLLLDVGTLASASPRAIPLWVAAGASRWAMAVGIWALPSARADGLAAAIRTGIGPRHALVATILAAALLFPAGAAGLAGIAAAAGAAALVGARAARVLGGATGDVHGAIGELSFTSALVAAVVIR